MNTQFLKEHIQIDKGIADPHIRIFFNLKNKWHSDTFYKLMNFEFQWQLELSKVKKVCKRFAKRSHIERPLHETPKFIDTEKSRLVAARGWGKDV